MTETTQSEQSTQAAAVPAAAESFAQYFEQAATRTDQLREGDIVVGTVIKIGRDNVVVDIGYKSEGIIPIDEFADAHGKIDVKPGDRVDVLIESKENEDGLLVLSKEKADKLKVWDEITEVWERNELIEGTIVARVKGGLAVSIKGGVKAFLPGSQVDLRPARNLDKFIGQTCQFKVIKFNKKRGNIVVSRRVLLERQRDELKQQTLQNLQEGQVVTGVIKNLTDYGAFVDLGGIDGLLHITDMSWGRVGHPSEMFDVGQKVTCKVLKYNPQTERVSLGLRQMVEDPWTTAPVKYPPGSRVEGEVVSLTDYGAFVELEKGVEGLIHVSEMTWTKPKHPSKVLNLGQTVECIVLDIDAQAKRISLGLKQLAPDPWTVFVEKYNPGDIIQGKVRSITEYGVFVEIEEGVDGMVHKSDISWTQRINNPAELYRKGDEVQAIILSINHEERKVSLGIKQLYEDPWTYIPERYPVGTVLEVRAIGFGDGGIYVELERGVEGFIPRSELSHDSSVEPADAAKPGQILKAGVIDLDPVGRAITLSLKEVEDRDIQDESMRYGAEKPEVAAARRIGPSGRPGVTLGDILKQQLDGLVGDEGAEEGEADTSGEES